MAEEEPCDCGFTVRGQRVLGVITGMDTWAGIQQCDNCDLYHSDLVAAQVVATIVGGVVRYYAHDPKVDVEPTHEEAAQLSIIDFDGTNSEFIHGHTNPWVERKGAVVIWVFEGST